MSAIFSRVANSNVNEIGLPKAKNDPKVDVEFIAFENIVTSSGKRAL